MDKFEALLIAQSALRERKRSDSAKAMTTNNGKFWVEGAKEADEALDIIKSMLKELRA